ncbi:hypothetical protein AAHC03_019317 [Spirometra sp. Aus1]
MPQTARWETLEDERLPNVAFTRHPEKALRHQQLPSFLHQYKVLLWKSFLIRRRQPLQLAAEIITPLLFIIVLACLRSSASTTVNPSCYVGAQALPSMGFLSHLQSTICNFNYTCHPWSHEEEVRPPVFWIWEYFISSMNSSSSLQPIGELLHKLLETHFNLSSSSSATTAQTDLTRSLLDALHMGLSKIEQVSCIKANAELLPPLLGDLRSTLITGFCKLPEIGRQSVLKSLRDLVQDKIPDDFVNLLGPALHSIDLIKNFTEGHTYQAQLENGLLHMAELMSKASVLFCGSDPHRNNFLTLPVFLSALGGAAAILPKGVPNGDACSVLNQVFRHPQARPWMERLRSLLQGRVLYYPKTPFTDAVIARANQSAQMFARLKQLSDQWMSLRGDLLPSILYKSTLAQTLRSLGLVCITRANISPTLRGQCRRIVDFLLERKTPILSENWSDLVGPLNKLSDLLHNLLNTCVRYDRFLGFTDEKHLQRELDQVLTDPDPVILVIFDKVPTNSSFSNSATRSLSSSLLSLRFRLPARVTDATFRFKVLDNYWKPDPRNEVRDSMKYFTSGFIDLQDQIERAYISLLTGYPDMTGPEAKPSSNLLLPTEMQLMPNPCYRSDPMLRIIVRNLDCIICIVWICTSMFAVRAVVYEKELRLKEFTKVLGLGNFVHWLNWFTVTLAVVWIPTLLVTILLKFGGICPSSDFSLLLVFLLAFLWALIPQAFLVSVFFTQANFAAIATGLIYFLLFVPYVLVFLYDLSGLQIGLMSLSPQVAAALSFSRIGNLENTGMGATWEGLNGGRFTNDPFNLGQCLGMLALDGLLAWLCLLYLEAVLPSTYGLSKAWYFPCTRNFWRPVAKLLPRRKSDLEVESAMVQDDFSGGRSFNEADGTLCEPRAEGQKVGVSVRGLTKRYVGSQQAAVNNLWVDFYEGQITSFLGHNGAGKTSTICLLTGIYRPTAGTAHIYGRDITESMDDIRTFLGLCPQHNILFDYLTVEEHLRFYAYIKGMREKEMRAEIDVFLGRLELREKAHEYAKNLSGGQKRRLSLAAAFIGGSKIVFLDEPTAGVDPHSRRAIWQLILHFRESRTIILTTHHMDEADALGDRIVIISQGRAKASGSSLFLKSHLARSYYLIIEKTRAVQLGEDTEYADERLAKALVAQLPGTQLQTSSPTEWIFTLPAVGAINGGFVDFFAYLESNREALKRHYGVQQYGLSDTSLEEIFLLLADDPNTNSFAPSAQSQVRSRLGHLKLSFWLCRRQSAALEYADEDLDVDSVDDVFTAPAAVAAGGSPPAASREATFVSTRTQTEVVLNDPPTQLYRGCCLYLQQAKALLSARFLYSQRSVRGWFLEIVLPALTLVILMGILTNYNIQITQPAMPLHPWLMADIRNKPKLRTFFETNIGESSAPRRAADRQVLEDIRLVADRYAAEMLARSGWTGTRCLPPSVYGFEPKKFAWCRDDYTPPTQPLLLTPTEMRSVRASVNVSCECGQRLPTRCHLNAIGGFQPPGWHLASTDVLYNLTGYNLTDYLTKTHAETIMRRYGGLSIVMARNAAGLMETHRRLTNRERIRTLLEGAFGHPGVTAFGLQLAEFLALNLPPTHFARIWYNNKGYASSVAYLNTLHNLQLRMLLPNETLKSVPGLFPPERDAFGMAIATHPFPHNTAIRNFLKMRFLIVGVFKALGTILALSFVPASFTLYLIDERSSGAKALQLLSGQSRLVYWVVAYVWDFGNFLVSVAIVTMVFVAFDEQAFIGSAHVGGFLLLLIQYGLCIIPLMYLLSFLFRVRSMAFVFLMAFNLVLGVMTTLLTFVLDYMERQEAGMEAVNQMLKMVFLIFPQFSFGRGFYELAKRHMIISMGIDVLKPGELYSWDLLGSKLMSLTIETALFLALLLLVEYAHVVCKCCASSRPSWQSVVGSLDPDVREEELRVLQDPFNEEKDVVRVLGLTKFFPPKKIPTVRNLTFGVRSGECFGLLGVNGAGKTTTFNMLTANMGPDQGEIWIDGRNLRTETCRAHNEVGYCPQFDALHPHLSGFETLQFYARIRGFPEHTIRRSVDRLIDGLSLRPHAHKLASSYSGGNLRKLSTAVAILGGPRVLLLDEPTSGMDPGAKRHVWNVLKSLLRGNCSIVLTSHSMEECEVLCNRLAIMVAGQFRCFGTVSRLKERFGEGYIIEMDINEPAITVTRAMQAVFGEETVHLTDSMGLHLTFQITSEVALSAIFQQLTRMRSAGEIKTFAVRQASLDNVFVNFVRRQASEGRLRVKRSGQSSLSETPSV